MAGGGGNEPGGMISGINMTPLVDIMLVLLIIFLVTAKLTVTPPNAIPMQLPKSATGEGTQVVFAITLGKDGSAAVNGQRLGKDDELLPLAAAEHRTHPDVHAVIQADGQVLHERVIHVLDLLAQAGVTQVAFGVDMSRAGASAP